MGVQGYLIPIVENHMQNKKMESEKENWGCVGVSRNNHQGSAV